jgi:hypothetical protein
MKASAGILLLLALSGCTSRCSFGTLTPEELEAQERKNYQGMSTPENVASDPELRSLVPAAAVAYGWKFPNEADFWHVDTSLSQTLDWYKTLMASKGFEPTLRQCTERGIFGGRVVIVDYCTADTVVTVNLLEDTTRNVTALTVSRRARQSYYRCDDPDRAELRKMHTAGCPKELLP